MFDVVIVNWNSGRHLAAAFESLLRNHAGLVSTLVVVDNASVDHSLDFLDGVENLPFSFELIENSINRGFGFACNQGARRGKAENLVFLNPDAQLLPGALLALQEALDDPELRHVGIVGPQNIDQQGNIARSCSRFPSVVSFCVDGLGLNKIPAVRKYSQRMAEWDHLNSSFVDQVIGACFVVRRPLFESLKGFDEQFFVYFEEVDFSLRARNAGACTYFLADAKTVHYGGGTTEHVKAVRLCFSLTSRLKYVLKHFSFVSAIAVILMTLSVECVARLFNGLARGGLSGVREVSVGYFGFCFRVPWIFYSSLARGR